MVKCSLGKRPCYYNSRPIRRGNDVEIKKFFILRKNRFFATLNANNKEYKLCAMVNHSGGTGGGHYTAACRRKNGSWIMANDNFITELNGLAKSSAHPPYYIYCSTPYRYVLENCSLYHAGDRDHVRIFW